VGESYASVASESSLAGDAAASVEHSHACRRRLNRFSTCAVGAPGQALSRNSCETASPVSCRKLARCSSRGTERRRARTSVDIELRSRRRRLHSVTRSPRSSTILSIQPESTARSSSVRPSGTDSCWYHSPSVASSFGSSVLAAQTPLSVAIMKKMPKRQHRVSASRVTAPVVQRRRRTHSGQQEAAELRPHYDFDYSGSRPNRFVRQYREGAVAIVLEPDVANVFRSAKAVNEFLRSAISAMPERRARKKKST
jgi:hypothetical protein